MSLHPDVDAGEFLRSMENTCRKCGCSQPTEECVACRAREAKAGNQATLVLITRDSNGNITDIREDWVN